MWLTRLGDGSLSRWAGFMVLPEEWQAAEVSEGHRMELSIRTGRDA